MNVINTNRKDVMWGYIAIFANLGKNVLMLPFILRSFPAETMAVWSVFATVATFVWLLDFGFLGSFARNVAYVQSGVKELKTEGYQQTEGASAEIDYGLYRGLINTMRWFYARIATAMFLLLAIGGTFYIRILLVSKQYPYSHCEVYTAWAIYIAIVSCNFYTCFYDAIMHGKGLVKQSYQIRILELGAYMAIAITLILCHFNLLAVVIGQAAGFVIRRLLIHRLTYTGEFKRQLRSAAARCKREVLRAVYPNAVKSGLATIGNLMFSQSAVFIGSLYLSLKETAAYSLTMQLVGIISAVAGVYLSSYTPKITQLFTYGDYAAVKRLYLKGCMFTLATYIVFGLGLLLLGEWVLRLVGSQTPLLPKVFIVIALVIWFLMSNHSIAANIISTENRVPWFKAAVICGAAVAVIIWAGLEYSSLGVWIMILAPGAVNLAYNTWKWPLDVCRQLQVTPHDVRETIQSLWKQVVQLKHIRPSHLCSKACGAIRGIRKRCT